MLCQGIFDVHLGFSWLFAGLLLALWAPTLPRAQGFDFWGFGAGAAQEFVTEA